MLPGISYRLARVIELSFLQAILFD